LNWLAEFKHSKRWRAETEGSWYLPNKAVIADIEHNKTLRHLPCGGRETP